MSSIPKNENRLQKKSMGQKIKEFFCEDPGYKGHNAYVPPIYQNPNFHPEHKKEHKKDDHVKTHVADFVEAVPIYSGEAKYLQRKSALAMQAQAHGSHNSSRASMEARDSQKNLQVVEEQKVEA